MGAKESKDHESKPDRNAPTSKAKNNTNGIPSGDPDEPQLPAAPSSAKVLVKGSKITVKLKLYGSIFDNFFDLDALVKSRHRPTTKELQLYSTCDRFLLMHKDTLGEIILPPRSSSSSTTIGGTMID